MRLIFLTLLFSYMNMATLLPQEAIYLKNPSFEDVPKYGHVPGAWRNCAFNNESPPDIHPVKNGPFGVNQKPIDGKTYIGLVARDNSSIESIGQELTSPLKAGQCYSLHIDLCRSEKLMSRSRKTGKIQNINLPVTLRIWGGISPCGHKSLLAISKKVDNTDWENFAFHFRPEEDLTWISFEAYYTEDIDTTYNGNLLMDNASPIIPISCDNLEALVPDSAIHQPKYNYVNYSAPENIRSKIFYSANDETGFIMDFRVVDKPDDIKALILDNCSDLGFQFSSPLLIDKHGIALKEIAVNVQKYSNTLLTLGMPNVGKGLVNKRKRRLKRILREIGLSKDQYKIIVLPSDWNEEEWFCGGRELWFKLEYLNMDVDETGRDR